MVGLVGAKVESSRVHRRARSLALRGITLVVLRVVGGSGDGDGGDWRVVECRAGSRRLSCWLVVLAGPKCCRRSVLGRLVPTTYVRQVVSVLPQGNSGKVQLGQTEQQQQEGPSRINGQEKRKQETSRRREYGEE